MALNQNPTALDLHSDMLILYLTGKEKTADKEGEGEKERVHFPLLIQSRMARAKPALDSGDDQTLKGGARRKNRGTVISWANELISSAVVSCLWRQ